MLLEELLLDSAIYSRLLYIKQDLVIITFVSPKKRFAGNVFWKIQSKKYFLLC